jgi:signal transduction histidine kinase
MPENELVRRGSDAHLMGPGTHLVQFYDAEEFLFDVVGTFIADGLKNGEPVIVIATAEHRGGFEASVAEKGFDTSGVLFLDARETMARFMAGPQPDEEQFMTALGGVLEQAMARAPKSRVRAYGEMVDLFWRDGNPDAAVRLEELWNDLGALYPFTLLCAYPIGNFYKESDASLFDDVCRTHGRVFPAESYDRGGSDDARLREIAALQQRAAALEAEIRYRREVERKLRAALDENARLYELAREINRTKDEFLATVSHELRTPLTAILGWARMLTLGSMDEKTTRTAIETIERSAKMQASLIDDLLDLSRIVTGKLALRSEPVDLGSVVDGAVQTLRLAAEARGIRIHVEECSRRCVVAGDTTRLQQIVWNLLSNAVKFSVAGGEVTVAIERDGGETARLLVRDRGRGISSDFLPHVFEPFRQADGASTRSYNGLGLGLAIVKYLVELHGGTVTAVSDGDGAGATFTVTLPLATRLLRDEPLRATGEDVADLTGATVFVVDDDADARDVIAAILRRCGAVAETFGSVERACMALGDRIPDVIVTDIAMPDQDGCALMQQMRASAATADLPVVALTAVADPHTGERLRAAGFGAYLRKPVDPVEFSRIVADARRA